jgi:thimet oligopeptidase
MPIRHRPPPGSPPAPTTTAGCRADLARAQALADALGKAGGGLGPTAEVLARFDEAFSALSEAGSRASLARNVHPDGAVRDAAEACEQEVAALATRLSLDRGLYDVLAALEPAGLDETARWFLEKSLRDFRRSGVDRDDATRARVQALQEELVRIGQEFGRTIRDDVRRLSLEPAALDGLPEDWRRAHPPGPDGRVAVTTDATDYVPFMTYARSEAARTSSAHRLRGADRLRSCRACCRAAPSWPGCSGTRPGPPSSPRTR